MANHQDKRPDRLFFRKALPVFCGNVFETYDFVLYGMLAPTFSIVFFPSTLDPKIALVLSFLLFFCAYLTRPIGGVLWGYIGDIYGRKIVLKATVIIMGISAIGVVCLPAYNQIGMISPIILIILRIMQGLAFAGEFPTVMVSLYELSPPHKKGFLCSFTETISLMGNLTGIIVCIILLSLLSKEQFDSFGWRIPFCLSFGFIFIVYYIRNNFTETLKTSRNKEYKKFLLLSNFKINILSIFKITVFLSTNSFLLFSFLFYTNQVMDYARSSMHDNTLFPWIIQFLCVSLLVLIYPVMGYFSDKIGIKCLSKIGHFVLVLCYYPIFYCLLLNQYLFFNILGIMLLAIIMATLAVSYIPIIIEMVGVKCRISTISLGWIMSVILFGASAPVVSELLINVSTLQTSPAIYLTILSIISLIILYRTNTSNRERHSKTC